MSSSFKMDKMESGERVANDASQLDHFMHEFEIIKEDVRTMEKFRNRLNETNEESKTIPDAAKMKELRALMDSDIDHVLKLAKSIKKRIEALEFMSSDNTIDLTKISVVMGLGKKLRDMMDEFQGLRVKMAAVYNEIVKYKYYSLTGEKQYMDYIENLASRGEIEDHLAEAVQEYGRDRVIDFIEEFQERREGSKNMQGNLVELHHTFLDMAGLVEAHGQKMSNNGGFGGENQAAPGKPFLKSTGVAQLLDHPEDYATEAKSRATIALFIAISLCIIIILPLYLVDESVKDLE